VYKKIQLVSEHGRRHLILGRTDLTCPGASAVGIINILHVVRTVAARACQRWINSTLVARGQQRCGLWLLYRGRGLSDTRSIRLSVPWRSCPSSAAAIGYKHAGCLQLSHVWTADPSTDGRRSATSRTAIGGGHIVSPHSGR